MAQQELSSGTRAERARDGKLVNAVFEDLIKRRPRFLPRVICEELDLHCVIPEMVSHRQPVHTCFSCPLRISRSNCCSTRLGIVPPRTSIPNSMLIVNAC